MTKVTLAVATVAIVSSIAIGGYKLGQTRGSRTIDQAPSAEPVEASDKVEQDAKLAGAIGRLERRLAALESRPAAIPSPEPAPSTSPAPRPGAGKTERFDPDKEEERRLERAAAIEAVLRTEQRDKAWASPTEGNLRADVDTVVNEGGKFSVKDIRCLTSICEMVLSAAAPEDLRYLADQLAPKITGMSSLELSPPATGADGRATVTCRLFRQGYPRPDEGML